MRSRRWCHRRVMRSQDDTPDRRRWTRLINDLAPLLRLRLRHHVDSSSKTQELQLLPGHLYFVLPL